MFEKFHDYMFSLLFSPLKKVRQSRNQFYLFFRIIGSLFDKTKQDIFRIREESMIVGASDRILSEHGRDRDMQRLEGESIEGYRIRLAMKGLIAEQAGTNQGILLALIALQIKRVRVEPYYKIDPERWAEFLVIMTYHIDEEPPISLAVIKHEVRKIKPASALDNYRYEYLLNVRNWEYYHFRLNRLTIRCHANNYAYRPKRFDGQYRFDGTINFNQQITQNFNSCNLIIRMSVKNEERTQCILTTDSMYTFNGQYRFDGKRTFNAAITKEEF